MPRKIEDLLDLDGNVAVVQAGELLPIKFVLRDDDDTMLDPNDCETITLKLWDEAQKAIINSNNGVNIKGANQGTIVSSGSTFYVLVRLAPSDNAIVNSKLDIGESEAHIIQITYTYMDAVGTQTGIIANRFFVQKVM